MDDETTKAYLCLKEEIEKERRLSLSLAAELAGVRRSSAYNTKNLTETRNIGRLDSIDYPSGGTKDRSPGWKVYIDVMDPIDTKNRIDAAKRWAAYAAVSEISQEQLQKDLAENKPTAGGA